MNNNGTAVVIGLVGVLIYIIGRKARLAMKLQYNFKGIENRGNILAPELFLRLQLTNPTNIGASVQSISGSIFDPQKQKIASVNSSTSINILPQKSVDLVLKIDPVVYNFLDLFTRFANNPNLELTFKGTIRVDGVMVPIILSSTIKDIVSGN